MIFSYLSNRTHRTKTNGCFSERSVLGPLLFNFDLIDLFYKYEKSNIASYADDTTPYFCASDTQTEISELKSISNKLFTCSSIIILKPILENVIYFSVPEPRLMYLLVMLHLKLAQKKPYLES